MPVRKTADHTTEVLRAIRLLTGTRLFVGVPEDSPRQDSGLSNAVIGYIMETGSVEAGIPERAHLVPAMQEFKPEIATGLRKAGLAALKGDRAGVEAAYTALGLKGQAAVRAKIQDGPFVPLAESTKRKRRARGRKGEKPLVDTGAYRNAVTYVVKKRGE